MIFKYIQETITLVKIEKRKKNYNLKLTNI